MSEHVSMAQQKRILGKIGVFLRLIAQKSWAHIHLFRVKTFEDLAIDKLRHDHVPQSIPPGFVEKMVGYPPKTRGS